MTGHDPDVLRELQRLTESELQAQVLEPLLRALGFEQVRDNSGPEELGKDLVAVRTGPFGRSKLFAFQVKRLQITGRAAGKRGIAELEAQLRIAATTSVVDPTTGASRKPDVCVFVTPFPIKPSVSARYEGSLHFIVPGVEMVILDGVTLSDQLRKYIPEFFARFSFDVRYRVHLEQELDRIPESRVAFGVPQEIRLSQIYVDPQLSCQHARMIELARHPLAPGTKEPRAILVEVADLSQLRDCASMFGVQLAAEEIEEIGAGQMAELRAKAGKRLSKRARPFRVTIEPLLAAARAAVRRCFSELAAMPRNAPTERWQGVLRSVAEVQERATWLVEASVVPDWWFPLVERQQTEEWQPPQIAVDAMRLLDSGVDVYLLGAPGAGKTTLLRQLARMAALTRPDHLPVFTPLISVRDHSPDGLIAAFGKQLGMLPSGGAVEYEAVLVERLTTGGVILLLDGLDEVGEDMERVMAAVVRLRERFPGIHIVLSCRDTVTAPAFPEAVALAVTPFSPKALAQFVEKWFTATPSMKSSLLSWLDDNPGMRSIVSTPIVAGLLCSLYVAGADMPATEVDLYQGRLDLLLGRWEQAKGMTYLSVQERKRYLRFLRNLAYAVHCGGERSISMPKACLVAGSALVDKYSAVDAATEAEEMVRDCIHRGILLYDCGGLSFGHLTYQEYLAACWLSEENDVEELIRRSDESWWQNTLRFYAVLRQDLTRLVERLQDSRMSRAQALGMLEVIECAPATDPRVVLALRNRWGF